MSAKYRPYLTRHQMEFILMRIADSDDVCAHEIRTTFNLLLLKMNAGLATGSYNPRKRATQADKLGFGFQDDTERRYLAGELSPEEEDAYLAQLMKGESI